MCSDPTDTNAKNPLGVSCAVLTDKNAVAGSAQSSETGESSGSGATNTTSDEWTYTFKNLPKYYKGKEIHYSVTEEAVDGYKPVSLTGGKTVAKSQSGATADATTTDESWRYQLTNKYTAVKLPSTGGEGDGNYMRAGLIALLVGTLCLVMALRRKERN